MQWLYFPNRRGKKRFGSCPGSSEALSGAFSKLEQWNVLQKGVTSQETFQQRQRFFRSKETLPIAMILKDGGMSYRWITEQQN